MNLKGLTVVSREKWGAKCGRGGTTAYTPNTTIYIHHSAGMGLNIDSYAEQVNAMRAIEHHHCRVNGWDGIGYNFIVFQPFKRRLWHRARVFEGRGLGHIPAAQAGHNSGNVSVCVVGNFEVEGVHRGTVGKLVSLVKRLPGRKIRGHRDVGGTACPGDHLYHRLQEIRKRAGKVG
jgi:N-acetylmuramoyl-L-alanine amidase